MSGITFGVKQVTSCPETAQQLDARFYKTKLCSFHLVGRCTRGPRCTFAHEQQSLVTLPDLRYTRHCRPFFMNGFCKKGQACTFLHVREESPSASSSFCATDPSGVPPVDPAVPKMSSSESLGQRDFPCSCDIKNDFSRQSTAFSAGESSTSAMSFRDNIWSFSDWDDFESSRRPDFESGVLCSVDEAQDRCSRSASCCESLASESDDESVEGGPRLQTYDERDVDDPWATVGPFLGSEVDFGRHSDSDDSFDPDDASDSDASSNPDDAAEVLAEGGDPCGGEFHADGSGKVSWADLVDDESDEGNQTSATKRTYE
mmetsp:Transcript_16255/g.35565  ORF Transcript_16255/g.35565 Transcript_16255/m.35565 type:complete len:316 (-) Transcript_16255:234-1181(-)